MEPQADKKEHWMTAEEIEYVREVAGTGRQSMKVARDLEEWQSLEEAHVKHWMNLG